MFAQTANWWHQLAMLTSSRCLLGTMKMLMFCTAGLLLQGGPGQARGAEAPRRQVSHFCARSEARVAVPRFCAPRPTMPPVVHERSDDPSKALKGSLMEVQLQSTRCTPSKSASLPRLSKHPPGPGRQRGSAALTQNVCPLGSSEAESCRVVLIRCSSSEGRLICKP